MEFDDTDEPIELGEPDELPMYNKAVNKIKRLEAELARVKALYQEWGYKDAPCQKHSKESLLVKNCASCRAEKAEAEVARIKTERDSAIKELSEVGRKWGEAIAKCDQLYDELTKCQTAPPQQRAGEACEGGAR